MSHHTVRPIYNPSGGLFIPLKSDKSTIESGALLTDRSRLRATLCCSNSLCVRRLLCLVSIHTCQVELFVAQIQTFLVQLLPHKHPNPLSSSSYFMIIYGPWPLLLTFYGFRLQNYPIKALFSSVQTALQWHHLPCDQWVHIHTHTVWGIWFDCENSLC